MENVFVDPVAISPRELTLDEMNQLTGGVAPVAVVWVTSCGEMLAGGVAITIITGVEAV